jgi:hypothetical protein
MYSKIRNPSSSTQPPPLTLFTSIAAPNVVKIIEIIPTIGQRAGAGTK